MTDLSIDFLTILILFSVLAMAAMLLRILERLGSIERTWASSALRRIELLEERISRLENSSADKHD